MRDDKRKVIHIVLHQSGGREAKKINQVGRLKGGLNFRITNPVGRGGARGIEEGLRRRLGYGDEGAPSAG